MKIQLSISLLASDKPAALERCLDSLKPLLMKVPSELIVVLTGTDEHVRKTVGLYTDQAVPFVWCDDFSAARNQGLKLARGEWFLYLDDDEWFEDTSELCDFFLSGEYQAYGMAIYQQRDYGDWSGITYADFPVLRMFRRVPGIHFENPIHEEVTPRLGACKYLDTYVHHYGYIENNGRSYAKKTSRNIPLLLQDIRTRPSYVKNYVQLSKEYQSQKDWLQAEKYCREGLRRCRKAQDAPFLRLLQADLMDILYEKNDCKAAEQEILTILERDKPCEMVCLLAYLILNKIYKKWNLPEEALRYGLVFEETLAYMDKNPQLWQQQQCAHLSERRIKQPFHLHQIRINCVEDALKLGDIPKASYFFALLPWTEEAQMQRFYPPFDFLKEQHGELFGELIEGCSIPSPYILLQKTLAMKCEKEEDRREAFAQCMKGTASDYLQRQVIKSALLSGTDLSGFVTLLDLDGWKQSAAELVNTLSVPEIQTVQKAMCILKKKLPLYGLLLQKSLLERTLIRGYLTGEKLTDALSEYVNCALSYYRLQYRQELFEEDNRLLLPKDCRFALLLSEALGEIKSGSFPSAVRLFRKALTFMPAMTGVIHELTRQIADPAGSFLPEPNEELRGLAVQMKAALNELIGQRRYTEADAILRQLASILPKDLELLRIRQKLLRESQG